jgi:hypothetical protein
MPQRSELQFVVKVFVFSYNTRATYRRSAALVERGSNGVNGSLDFVELLSRCAGARLESGLDSLLIRLGDLATKSVLVVELYLESESERGEEIKYFDTLAPGAVPPRRILRLP